MGVYIMNITEFNNEILDLTRKINENTNIIFNPVCEQYGLTALQARILMKLHMCEKHTIGSLAERVCSAEANMSAMCKKLEKMDLIVRVRDKEDERVVKVNLTDKGKGIVFNINELLDEKISKSIQGNMEETLEDIIRGAKKLNDLLEKAVSSKG
jgi:DNA-binding MarR family transcriptional regulator